MSKESRIQVKAKEKHLEFTVKGITFKNCGTKRDKNGNFNLIKIKNVDTGAYKYIQWSAYEKIINKI